jgi:serine phosphatase RsbU (regulator of sigma subunit)
MFLVSFLIYRNLQRKKRDNILITSQKEEIVLQKHEIEEKHREITDSIDYAKRIQTALLTSDEYWKEISRDHFILFQPKDIVSGDFFWAFQSETKEGKLAIWCAADCTGHGVPGAFMSMLGISFLNEIVVESGIIEVNEILERLRNRIISTLMQKKGDVAQRDGMDIALCVWNKTTNVLEFSGANNPLWLVREERGEMGQGTVEKGQGTGEKGRGKEEKNFDREKNDDNTNITPGISPFPPVTRPFSLLEIKPDKMPVGKFGDELEPFTKQVIQLEKGDMIYSFSDGFSDQFGGPQGKKLRSANFKKIILEVAHLTGDEQKAILADKFNEWRGSLEQIDDVCVIGIRV